MERTNGGLPSKCAVLIPVSKSSVVFEKVLAPLQKSFLYGQSKEAFRYPSAFLFKSTILHEKYAAFRANRREAGYSEEELREGYGFLLFDDINKAAKLGETGVLTGNSTCKTLGDPSKGVYVARYSDCLAPDHWYSGKSGFIVIIKLTKGRSNKVKENYTQNCIRPSVGFDCHESIELPMVSANTSSFLAYERTQFYLYEALPGDCNNTNPAPSHVCPFAIVPFSYDDASSKATMSGSQKRRGTEGNVLNDFMWKGQLHISSKIFHVRLKSRSGTLVPVKLPPVVKVDQAVSMVTLRQFAPKAVFETRFSGEVCMDGICCSVHEFVPEELEDPSLSLLIRELKDKDLGLTVHLDESGFLILLHSSNFSTCIGNQSSVTEALQAMFLFPGSIAIQRDTRGDLGHSYSMSYDNLQILPALAYAETEMQKISIGSSGDIRGQFEQQIKNYAALLQTGLAADSSKNVSPLSQDYDRSVPSLFVNPKWTNRLWQWLRSYLSHPVYFQLPVYSVTKLLAVGNQLPKEHLDEDLPSLEQAPVSDSTVVPEELLTRSTACDVSSSWQKDVDKKDSETKSASNGPLSHNPTAELVVSITSAEGTSAEGTSKVVDEGLRGSDATVATKQLSNTPTATTNTVDKNPLENTTPGPTKGRPRGRPKGKRKRFRWSSPPADEPLTSTPESPDKELNPAQSRLNNDSPETEWTILSMSQCKGGKLTYKYKKVPRSPQLQEDENQQTKPRRSTRSTRYDPCSLLRKTDRTDLRPILTACGRTLVPHGSQAEWESTDLERHFKETVGETSEEASPLEQTNEDPVAERLATNTANNVNSGDTCSNTEVGPPREPTSSPPESRDHSIVNIAEADSTGGVPSSAADDSLPLPYRNNSERLLYKLKRLCSKKKNTQLGLGDSVSPVDAPLSSEPLLKKSKSDTDGKPLSTDSNTECPESRERNKDIRIAFAQALGLRPTEVQDRMEETQPMVTLQHRLPFSPEAQLTPLEVESAQVLHKDPSPIKEKPQVERLLKKTRTKWGKRLTTFSSSNAERPENQTKSNSVETNLKELFRSNGQSNALSLLAALALGDGNNQPQPQLDPLSTTKPDPRSDVDNRLNDGTKPDTQSVLPSTLQQPADGPVLPLNSPSPESILGSKDVIGLIAQEHDYTWSSASQVPNTSSPAGIPEHSQISPPEGPSEHKAAVGHMTRDAIRSRRFRRSRTFVEREGVLQVTRKWKGSYDFDLDSKFTNHPVEKTVCRGLHGSWNSAGKDGGEEAQLLIHMWIGLFYSRSTPRFIHSSPLDLEDCLEKTDVNVPLPTIPETTPVAMGDSDGQDVEPIQKDRLFHNQGEEILDLSIKKQAVNDGSDVSVSRHEKNVKEASGAFIREAGRPDEGPAQCQAKHGTLKVRLFYMPSKLPWAPKLPNDTVQPMTAKNVDVHVDQVYKCQENKLDDKDGNDDNIIKSTSKRADSSTQSATNLEHSAVHSLSEDKTCDSLCKVKASLIIQPRIIVETQASIDPETSEMEERKENLQNAEVAVEKPIEKDSACEIMKGIVEDGTEENYRDESKCENHRNNADSGLPLIHNEDPTTGHKSPVPYVSLLDDETQSMVTSVPLPQGSNENEDEDCQSVRGQGHFTKEEDNHLKPNSVSDGRYDPGGSDVRVVSCDQQEQDDKLVGNEVETAPIRAHSPQNGVLKLLQDPSEIPLVGKDNSKPEVEAVPQVLPSQDNPLDLALKPKETALNIDVYCTPQENGEKVPKAKNVVSVFEERDPTHKLGSEDSEVDKRCPPPTKGDGPGCYFKLSLVGEPYEVDGTKDASSDEMLWMHYANTDSCMAGGSCEDDDDDDGDDAISEGNFNLTLDESIPEEHDDDTMDEVDSEIESQQSNSDNHSTPLQEGIEGKSQAEVEPDLGVGGCDHQDPYDDLVENEVESAYILAQKAASRQRAKSPQDGVSKLLQVPSEMPWVSKEDSKQEMKDDPQVLPLQDNPVKLLHKPKEMALNIDVYRKLLENREKVPIAENILSVFQDRDSKHELGTEDGELEKRCPRPTKWDGPVVYCQATLVRQPYEGDGKKDAACNDMLQMQCANLNAFMAGGGNGGVNDNNQDDTDGYDTVSEENLNVESDKTLPDEHDNIDSTDEGIIETSSQQNMSDNDSTPIQDGLGVEHQAEAEPDVSVVSCNHQELDDKLVGKKVETACILTQEAASHQPSIFPKDGVSKLLQDSKEMPIVGKDKNKEAKQEVTAGPQVLPSQDSSVKLVNEPKEMPLSIDVYHTPSENGEKVQIAKKVLTVLEDSNCTHKLGSEDSEVDERYLLPTNEDGPGGYLTLSIVGEPYDGIGTKDAETAQKAASPKPSDSLQDGVSKLLQDSSEMLLVGKDDSKQEVEAGPQVLPLETGSEPNEMAMNTNVFNMSLENSEKAQTDKNIPSDFKECNHENKLGSETSEFDERCPTPTIDEDPYEDFPSQISNQVCKIVPEEERGNNSTLSHLLGKEVDAEPVLKAVRDQDPEGDLLENNHMDNLNDGTRLVNVGIPAKKLRVKRKRSRFSDIAPCPAKKMNIIQEICEAQVREDLQRSRLRPVVVLELLTGLERTDIRHAEIYRVKDMDNLAISKTSDDNQSQIPVLPIPLSDTLSDNRRDVLNHTSMGNQHENKICSRTDRVSEHGVGECVPKRTNDIDALYHVEEQGHLKPSRTVQSIASTQSGEGENLSSSSCQDPIQDCPVEKGLGPSCSNHTDPFSSSFKYTNYRFTKTVTNSLGNITEKCMNSDLTQFSMEQDFLIFSEEMKRLLTGNKRGPGQNPNHRSMHSNPSSDSSPSVMDEDMPESGLEKTIGEKRKDPSSRRNCAEANGALCDIEAICARSYRTMMDNVCAGKGYLTETDGAVREHSGPIKKMRSDMFGSMNQGLNVVVRKSSKAKFKFFILTTSEDAFFKDTKAQLEGAGHTEEQPYHFLLSKHTSSLLLIILKNEDIAEHIVKVPHLLELKKSANVLFAGIDHPKDIGNLTHQDIFKKGGFIMLEGASLESLTFGQMKALLDFLQELSRNGKWKWILHYRDIRRLKENSRFNAGSMDKKNLMKSCQDTGIVEVLPYHECDQTCRPHPRYLKCLMQLQVQNITARFPVFITDITNPTEDRSFERHGILTMNINTLLNVIEHENFSPSTSI